MTVSLLTAAGDPTACRWVVGEPRALTVCGDKALSGRPYCHAHDYAAHNQEPKSKIEFQMRDRRAA